MNQTSDIRRQTSDIPPTPAPITYPAYPTNGGPLHVARPKLGTWLVEPKFNGWRALVHVPTGSMWNREGQRLTIESEFAKALAELRDECSHVAARRSFVDATPSSRGPTEHYRLSAEESEWADCEALERRHNRGRGSLVLIDLPMLKLPLKMRGYIMRRLFCQAIDHCASRDSVYSVPQYTDAAAVYAELKMDNAMLGCEFYEGIVMKKADSPYPIQLRSAKEPTRAWVKHRWAW